jgi:hypothetical protein
MQESSLKNFKITTLALFKRQVKRLTKKFPSLKGELSMLVEQLSTDPFMGEPLGHDCFKIRIAIESKGKGKSGGARLITNVIVSAQEVFLLTIYDKSEIDSISVKEILILLKSIR